MTKQEKTILFDTIRETHRLLKAFKETEHEAKHRRAYVTLINLRDALGLFDDYVNYKIQLDNEVKA